MKRVTIKDQRKSMSDLLISGTGEDDNAENEDKSPTKKAQGKPGRKPGQTSKNASKKDNNQENDNETGNNQRSTTIYVGFINFRYR